MIRQTIPGNYTAMSPAGQPTSADESEGMRSAQKSGHAQDALRKPEVVIINVRRVSFRRTC